MAREAAVGALETMHVERALPDLISRLGDESPAVAMAALQLVAEGRDELMLVLPADHVLDDQQAFRQALALATVAAEKGEMVLFGVPANRPETGYGYILGETDGELPDGVARVSSFVEKPDAKRASEYVESGNYYWNSGMFLFRASRFLEELKQHDVDIYDTCLLALERSQREGEQIAIDPATRASLEIDQAIQGGRKGTLLATVDCTLTAPGARLFADRLSRPECDRDIIERRYDAVSFFLSETDLRADIRACLKAVPDLERARTRIRLERGGPRDLQAIANAVREGGALAEALSSLQTGLPEDVAEAVQALDPARNEALAALASDLADALAESLPTLARDGGFIADGWDQTLDESRSLRRDSRQIIAELQARYCDETGISALKIKFNNVLGYFIDVPARHGDALLKPPHAETFIHRQTLASNIRFSTAELSDLAGRISRAEEASQTREMELYQELCLRVEAVNDAISAAAHALASIDVATAAAEWADRNDAVRPEIAATPVFQASGLRHPVVEAALKAEGEGFTANDLTLDAAGETGPRLALVTGPNMAGKSTYLRQNALIAILAQMGAYVPARSARIGVVSQIFSRVGASDDLARGRSTFMVEMVETAAILAQATPNSFVILDEVGRGTSTYDGLAIAWAVVEAIHEDNRCRCLFATHYHELTRLAERCDALSLHHVRAREWKGDLVLLHEVSEGPADRSYGLAVARLAGMPPATVKRAQAVLSKLEAGREKTGGLAAGLDDLPLFAAAAEQEEAAVDALRDELAALDVDALSPREALDTLYRLKSLANEP